ncbi:helix-turn-helix domain-containing protein [Ferruginibacter sp. SUN002]|uniref:helix-turn-helix domain-containing protein n=1 Tax=Ferruginibacter sp. SUN002 TaxID=2937789 RepID=UPI003D35B232
MATQQHIDHNEVFDLAFRFVTETNENIFLTGKAGTGKTTFLKYLKDNCTKNVVIAAPTGVAAINAGGVTLHSLFQLPFEPFLPTAVNKNELLAKIHYNRQRQQLLRKMELLIIDEISMVRSDVMDAIDTILKSIRRNYDTPFGGVQLLCIGDLHQLAPVAQNQEWSILQEYYSTPFFFDSHAIKEQMPLLIELNKIYRQKDESFVRLLNKVRNNQMDKDDFEDLHLRFDQHFTPPVNEKYITLTSHNRQSDQINLVQLHKLFTPEFKYTANIEGEFSEKAYPAEVELVLKVGAQVMFLKNDAIQKRYFNGKIGVIKSLEKERIIVEADGFDIDVSLETWENTRYTLNKADGKLEQEVVGSFSQYPLRLAWAITIHKSQGLTFEKVMIDAGSAFSSGQVYVALSRCTSLEGIVLLSKIPSSAIQNNDNVIKGLQSLTHKGSLAERFAGARQVYTQQLLEEIFSFEEVNTAATQLQFHVKKHLDKLNPESEPWVNDLKNYINSEQVVGLKFISRTGELMKEEGIIEKNMLLQQRIMDAANHFIPKFSSLQQSLQKHPIITEHKEAATEVNEYLQQLALSIHTLLYYLEYCKQPFAITSFLKKKLNYALPRISITCYASGKKEIVSTDTPNLELYNTLKRWRDMVIEETQQPIYMVANQATLKEICTYLPLTKKDLMQISGFGKAKVEKYGDDIIEAVESYCHRHGVETNMFAKEGNPKKERKEKSSEPKVDTKKVSFDLFKEGKTIDEIATIRNFTKATIEGHLSNYIGTGEINIDDLVNKEKQLLIKNAITVHGRENIKILVDNLPGIGYGEVRMVLASGMTNE